MATNFKKIRDLNPYGATPYGVNRNRYEEYVNLLMNAVKITDLLGNDLDFATEVFAKRALIEQNIVGYDKTSAKWYYVYGEGRNELGNPTDLVLVTANGKTFNKKASYDDNSEGAYIIKALPVSYSLGEMIKATTNFMCNCDIAIGQNVDACKTPYIVVCKDKDLQLSLEQALQQKILGQAVIIVSEQLGDGIKSIPIEVNYMADKFAELRDLERDTLLNKLGIMTANIDKKERVQSAEVNATIGQATDYIYMLIDTFNKQMDTYALPFKMQLNGALEEIYLDNDTVDDFNVNDVEEKNNFKD